MKWTLDKRVFFSLSQVQGKTQRFPVVLMKQLHGAWHDGYKSLKAAVLG